MPEQDSVERGAKIGRRPKWAYSNKPNMYVNCGRRGPKTVANCLVKTKANPNSLHVFWCVKIYEDCVTFVQLCVINQFHCNL